VILAVDDDPEGLERTERELRKRYKADYGVVGEAPAGTGLRSCETSGWTARTPHTATPRPYSRPFRPHRCRATDRLVAGEVERDEKGYVITGTDLLRGRQAPEGWPLERAPLLLETSVPGVFAAGDVRHGSTKRAASAVGEGSIVIRLVHGCREESAERTGRRQVSGNGDYPSVS
jgi:hypothetical protein